MIETKEARDQYATEIAGDILERDRHDNSAFYVQSFIVAVNGAPVLRARWNAEGQMYDLVELDKDANDYLDVLNPDDFDG